MMNTKSMKSLLSLAVLAAALAPAAAFASTSHVTPSMNAFFGKEKMVRFNLRNQTNAPIGLRAGDQTMTVGAGKTIELKLAAGTRIVTVNKTEKLEAGALVCEASSALSDSTLVLN